MNVSIPVSCSKLNCPSKKRCLLDQNMIPHCVNCTQRKCGGGGWSNSIHVNSTVAEKELLLSASSSLDKSICGSDGLTYPSMCDLRQAACLRGKAIPVAYKGPCRSTCNNNTFYSFATSLKASSSTTTATTTTSLNATNNPAIISWCNLWVHGVIFHVCYVALILFFFNYGILPVEKYV